MHRSKSKNHPLPTVNLAKEMFLSFDGLSITYNFYYLASKINNDQLHQKNMHTGKIFPEHSQEKSLLYNHSDS